MRLSLTFPLGTEIIIDDAIKIEKLGNYGIYKIIREKHEPYYFSESCVIISRLSANCAPYIK